MVNKNMENDLRQWMTLLETEIKMGLPKEAMLEIDACLQEAHSVLIAVHKTYQQLSNFAALQPEQQQRADDVVAVIARLGKFLRPSPRVALLDDVLTALGAFKLTFVPLQQVFVLPEDQTAVLHAAQAAWKRCYTCFYAVTVND